MHVKFNSWNVPVEFILKFHMNFQAVILPVYDGML